MDTLEISPASGVSPPKLRASHTQGGGTGGDRGKIRIKISLLHQIARLLQSNNWQLLLALLELQGELCGLVSIAGRKTCHFGCYFYLAGRGTLVVAVAAIFGAVLETHTSRLRFRFHAHQLRWPPPLDGYFDGGQSGQSGQS
jgi:hypothetical protein